VGHPELPLGLKAALREDPDVILVGEIRDRETAETVIHAAETGHLVFSTLHTIDTVETINRYIGMFPMEYRDQIRQMLVSHSRLLPETGTQKGRRGKGSGS